MRDILRFITCGSVDDGKSTLLGRLLWETGQVFSDHLSAVERDSGRYGTQGEKMDLALLLDGLQAEREQGITIDVAYRFFATPRRRFIVADTPGHEQYTRNMATGASTCEAAILVVDAAKGLQIQTHRHARIVALLGIRHLAMAVNKMDLIGWDREVYDRIVAEIEPTLREIGIASFQAIPVSALNGDNLTHPSGNVPWYKGPTLLAYLEGVDVDRGEAAIGFRMPVQWVNRPDPAFRGYCGRIASGEVKRGDRVRIVPGGTESRVRSIVVWQGEQESAAADSSVTLCLEDEVDVSRGSVISSAIEPIECSDQFEARLLALSEHMLVSGRSYLFRMHTFQASATITTIKYQLDVKTGSHLASRGLNMNEIGVVNLSLDRAAPFESYDRCRRLGSFILVDRLTNQTVGAGMIDFALRRAANIHWQSVSIDKQSRARQKLQKPVCLWFTGLPGSGKSTIANLLEKRLFATGKHTYLLDGDNVRHGLNRDLGFTEADRVENIRRVTELARLFVDAGLIVIVSFISPFRAERELARSQFGENEFKEVFVDTPLAECERRDPKGLYAKARSGQIKNFTGIDSEYEPPLSPDLRLETQSLTPEECVDRILALLRM
ncbi:MAG: adenylyl-sulfate kinase [Terracidiphilus sp.]